MSHTWETHHPGCRQQNRVWLRGAKEKLAVRCCVIIELLNPSNWQLLSRTRGIFVGKRAAFLLPSFTRKAFAAGHRGIVLELL